jgi:hypothetical protein
VASIEFGEGKRNQRLAQLVAERNYDVHAETADMENGPVIFSIAAGCLTVTRDMVVKAYFAGKPEYEASVDKIMDWLAMRCKGKLISSTPTKIIVCDDDGDKAMSLRYKVNHQADIARLSERLGISRNDFVVRAIEHYVKYFAEIEEMED